MIPAGEYLPVHPPPSRSAILTLGRYVALSLILHALLLYAFCEAPFGGSSSTNLDTKNGSRINVVVLSEWSQSERRANANLKYESNAEAIPKPEPTELTADASKEKEARAQPLPAERAQPSTEVVEDKPGPRGNVQENRPSQALTEEPRADSELDSVEAPQDHSRIPIDFEEARRRVIDNLSEGSFGNDDYRTFSNDQLFEELPSAELIPGAPETAERPTVERWCPIVRRRAVQVALIVAGICFRSPQGSTAVLSRAKPEYLKSEPECAPVSAVDGNQAYKCGMVTSSR